MQNSPITLADIATMSIIAAGVFGIVFQLIRFLLDFLAAKYGKPPDVNIVKQSQQCRFDHEKINSVLLSQNTNIVKMLEQNGKQIDAFSTFSHQAELRHQIVLAKLDRIETLQQIPRNELQKV